MTIDIGVPTHSIYNVGALQMKGKTKLQSSSAQYWSRHTDTQSWLPLLSGSLGGCQFT